MLYEKAGLTKFCNIRKRTSVLQSLFNKVTGLKACNVTRERFQRKSFPVNAAKFLRKHLKKHLRTAAANIKIYMFYRSVRSATAS